MTLNASRFSLKKPAITAALLLASASVFAQQPTTPQSSADASKKKHLAGVKYESMTVKSANPNSANSTTAQPSSASPQDTKRKDGAINHADYDRRQAGESTSGAGAPADATRVNKVDSFTIKQRTESNPANVGIGPTSDEKTTGAPLKGIGTAGHVEGDRVPPTANKGIGSAGVPGKAASVQEKAQGVPLKGCGKCSTTDQSQKQPVNSAKTK